jgi:hypothetical protein
MILSFQELQPAIQGIGRPLTQRDHNHHRVNPSRSGSGDSRMRRQDRDPPSAARHRRSKILQPTRVVVMRAAPPM